MFNINLSNSQLNKLETATKNETKLVSRSLSNIIVNSDVDIKLPHKSLLTNRQVGNLRKAFPNSLTTGIKLSKNKLC